MTKLGWLVELEYLGIREDIVGVAGSLKVAKAWAHHNADVLMSMQNPPCYLVGEWKECVERPPLQYFRYTADGKVYKLTRVLFRDVWEGIDETT